MSASHRLLSTYLGCLYRVMNSRMWCGLSSVHWHRQGMFPARNLNFVRGADHSHIQRNTLSDSAISKAADDTDLTENLFTNICKIDKKISSISLSNFRSWVKELQSVGFSQNHIKKLLTVKPSLLLRSLTRDVEILRDNGFSPEQVMNILVQAGSDFSVMDFIHRLENFMKLGFDGDLTCKVTSFNVNIAYDHISNHQKRIADLKLLFKANDVLSFFRHSPDLLSRDWSDIAQVFDYVYHTMGIKQRSMVRSRVFCYDIDRIRTRHMFLERAGLYKRPRDKPGEVNQNVPLEYIITTTDEEFSAKFGRMTIDDLNAFSKILEHEAGIWKEEEADELD